MGIVNKTWSAVLAFIIQGKQNIITVLGIKDGLSLKAKTLHIHLYFIATQYLWKYALVEDKGNWTRSYILIIIYWNRQK